MASQDRLVLENDYLRAEFVHKGAELQRLRYKPGGVELMWSGDAAFWGKHSPILFPIVGALKDNQYEYRGERYSLGRHGFARDRYFELVEHDTHSITFRLCDDADTLRVYPFQFDLRVSYALSEESLSCTYTVSNVSSEDPLLFSVGAHPAFSVPFRSEQDYRDYYIHFDRDSSLERYPLTAEGLIKSTPEVMELDEHKLALSKELFHQDALVFKHFKSKNITLGYAKEGLRIEMNIGNFPFLGIWAAKDAPFVCLEPWLGIADGVDHNQDFEKKEGVIRLAPGQESINMWKIWVYD